jgi:hypothetical protein
MWDRSVMKQVMIALVIAMSLSVAACQSTTEPNTATPAISAPPSAASSARSARSPQVVTPEPGGY